MSKHYTILGIDGAGKTTLAKRLMASTDLARHKATLINAPNYHEGSDAPFKDLSAQLAIFSSVCDELKSFELKGIALYLQATLFGVIEQFFITNWQPANIISQRHPVLDSLVYGAFYSQHLKGIETSALHDQLLATMQARQVSLDCILRWFDLHQQRIKSQSSFGNFSQEILELFKLDWIDLVHQLQYRYQTTMPDVIIYVHPEVEVVLDKIKMRAQENHTNIELHEHLSGLCQLEKGYLKLLQFVKLNYPHIQIVEITAYDDMQVDKMIQSFGAS